MTFNAIRGSSRRAIHQNAGLPLHPPKEKYQLKKLVSVVSWIGFLASAVSEYGFDADFPLTPAFWLAIAFCVMFASIAPAVIGRRIHGIGKQETGTYLSGDVPSPSDSASLVSTCHKSPRISDRFPSICQDNFRLTGRYCGQMSSGGGIVTVSEAIPAAIFLSPAATREPPWSDNQIGGTLGRPARCFFTTPLPSDTNLSSSRSSRITPLPTNQDFASVSLAILPLCPGLQTAHNVRRGQETFAEQGGLQEEGDQT